MDGIIYGIGVGPGDPELMTLRAVKRLQECDVIAVPHEQKEACVAYRIAKGAVSSIGELPCLCLPMPMTKDRDVLERSHQQAADKIAVYLDQGKKVGFITLGDVSIYSTFEYVMNRLISRGYKVHMESGIPSFCAAAAAFPVSLASGAEELHIIPASYQIEEALKLPGVKVLMKSGKKLSDVKAKLAAAGAHVVMVENCGMEGEHIYRSLDEIPDDAGYYSLLIVR